MPQVIYYTASSLDGYIAPEDGSLDWLSAHGASGEDYGYADFYESVDSVLIGRRTYEQCLAFPEWPYPGKPCWVFSSRPLECATAEVTITSDSPRQIVEQLETLNLRRAWLVGGGQLAGSFCAEGLITEYIITLLPWMLGAGTRLFAARSPVESLNLLDCRKFAGGLVQLRYRR